jgi:ArsR family transcriptional regulator, arsenate/arsenite/antimonite-responsive transcriptional repressor
MRDQKTNELAEVFKALGDPTRLAIFKMLSANPKPKLCVCAIATRLQISQPAVSQHLRVLKNAGLISPNRDGFKVHYAVNADKVKSVQVDLESISLVTEKGVRTKSNG